MLIFSDFFSISSQQLVHSNRIKILKSEGFVIKCEPCTRPRRSLQGVSAGVHRDSVHGAAEHSAAEGHAGGAAR